MNLFAGDNSSQSTDQLIKHIKKEKFLIKVAFVGEHLSTVIEYLESSGDQSYLVLHYTPSILTIQHSLVGVMFTDCRDPLLQRDPLDFNCLYTPSRYVVILFYSIQQRDRNKQIIS